jgi:hypothetical protein
VCGSSGAHTHNLGLFIRSHTKNGTQGTQGLIENVIFADECSIRRSLGYAVSAVLPSLLFVDPLDN